MVFDALHDPPALVMLSIVATAAGGVGMEGYPERVHDAV